MLSFYRKKIFLSPVILKPRKYLKCYLKNHIKYHKFREEEKELFTKAVIARFGNTNNIYAITNEQQSPVEFMTAFFYVKGGVAKFIGYFAHPFVH